MKNNLGENLAKLRKRERYSQKELANLLGINVNTYIGYETAGREPKFETLIKIADFFGISLDKLIRGNVDESEKTDPKQQALFNALANLSDETLTALENLLRIVKS